MQRLDLILYSIFLISSINVVFAGGDDPFTPRASLIRYWKNHISNDLPQPLFLLNKASPLTAVQTAAFSKLAAQNSLAGNLPSFCTAAQLLCFPDLSPSLEKHTGDVNFTGYVQQNFTNYGTRRVGSQDSFDSYSKDENVVLDNFRRYSRDTIGHDDKFSNYAENTNVPDENFNTYGTKAVGGSSDFKKYADELVNVPALTFTSYSDNTTSRPQTFTSYSDDGNSGDQSFASYSKNSVFPENTFTSYGKSANVIRSSFSNYDKRGIISSDNFTSYGDGGNVPENNFVNYGAGGKDAAETFTSYRDQSNVGDDSFTAYAKGANPGAEVKFINYGKSFNEGSDTFTSYGSGDPTFIIPREFDFKVYGVNNTFKEYANKKLASFASYTKRGSGSAAELEQMKASGKIVNKWVEPGKFFRESSLKTGTIMPMPRGESETLLFGARLGLGIA